MGTLVAGCDSEPSWGLAGQCPYRWEVEGIPQLPAGVTDAEGQPGWGYAGGVGSEGTTAEVWRLDIIATAWVPGAPLPEPRSEIARGDQFHRPNFVIGGTDGRAVRADVWRSSEDGAWVVDRPLPEPRAGAAVAQGESELIVAGGRGPDGTATTGAWWAALGGDHAIGPWVPLPSLPTARSGHGVVVWERQAWLFGGVGPAGERLADVWHLTLPDGAAWQPAAALPTAGEVQVAQMLDVLLLGAGGETWVTSADRLITGEPWFALPSNQRHRPGAALLFGGNEAYRVGGVDEAGEPTNEAWSLFVCPITRLE